MKWLAARILHGVYLVAYWLQERCFAAIQACDGDLAQHIITAGMERFDECIYCGTSALTCNPQLWEQEKKCCPDCTHG